MILIDKLNVDMRTMKSSWNEDRVAASYCNRRPAKKQGPRPSALYAQHKINTDIVTVFTRRGREVYTRRFGDTIRPSRIDGDETAVSHLVRHFGQEKHDRMAAVRGWGLGQDRRWGRDGISSILCKRSVMPALYCGVATVNQTRKELNEQVQLVSQEWFCLFRR